MLIVNADDWGRDADNTDRTLECIQAGAVSSVSAMVFMEDSERAAGIAREKGIDAGLHLNFTTAFSAPDVPASLKEAQQCLARFLQRSRFAPVVFHPRLATSFSHVTAAQFDEFTRLYSVAPERIDGHHHMHLSANVVLGRLLPAGTQVRRNFSFAAREKSMFNRLYRNYVDRILARRHHMTDLLFSLTPLEPANRLDRIFSLARTFTVELETHPVNPTEYDFLTSGAIFRRTGDLGIAPRYTVPPRP